MLWWRMEKPDTWGSQSARTRSNQWLVWGWIWGSQSRKNFLKLIPEIIWEVLQYLVDVQNLVRLCKCKEMRKIRKIVAIILSISITFPPLFSTTCPPSPHFWQNFKIWISTWLRDLQSLSLSFCLILTNLRFFPQTQIPCTSSAPHPRLLLLLNPEEKQVKGIRFNAFLLQLISGKKSLPPSPWQTLLCPSSPERG